jgi:hypothetical protein
MEALIGGALISQVCLSDFEIGFRNREGIAGFVQLSGILHEATIACVGLVDEV